jgi:hypothetical protein
MNISVVIPQLFYDAIARVIPGAVALVLAEVYGSIFLISAESKLGQYSLIEALGRGVELAIIAYVIGWILSGLTWPTFHPSDKANAPPSQESGKSDNGELSSRNKYQWIRLAHPEAGYRIVKLRAEAKMLESIRSAFVLSSIVAIILLVATQLDFSKLKNEAFILPLTLMLITSFGSALVIYNRIEREAWNRYTGNIASIYQLLHDKDNPIPFSTFSYWPPRTFELPSKQEKQE